MEDPLDNDDFDPIEYINKHFPTESSLDNLDTYMVGLNSKIGALEEEISKSVHAQSAAGQQATKDVNDAQKSINDLFTKINDIKAKATQSEKMVQEICSDIKKLDYAKTHLQSSITALKRLQMLITAVGKLEELAKDYHYKEVANLLDAVKQLLSHFDSYMDVPLVAELALRVNAVQLDLKQQVFKAFREIGQLVDSVADVSVIMQSLPGHLRSLPEACLVVDALGGPVRRELLNEFVKIQLTPYEQLFAYEKQHCTLDQVDRRWAWFKRLLKSVETKFATVCPAHWRLPLRLCKEFMVMTRAHLESLLTLLESKDQTDVSQLLKALQTALRFEQEMTSLFDPVFTQTGVKMAASQALTAEAVNPFSNTEHGDSDHTGYNSNNNTAGLQLETEDREWLITAMTTLKGGISGGFDKFLGSYVVLEKHNLEDMLKRLSQEEDTAQGTGDGSSASTSGNVYGSSMSMFVFIKNSIKRCTALTTGQTFLSLCKEFKTCMQQYVDMLRARVPPLSPQLPPAAGSSYTPQPLCKLALGQEGPLSYLINTGEYCCEVVPQLEQLIRSKLAEPYKDKVDLSSEADAFADLISSALKALVGGALDRLEPAFRAMAAQNWADDAQVGEESAYVLLMNSTLKEFVPRIRDFLSTTYFNSFCTRLATEALLRFHDIIMRQRVISEAGSQQLLLDAYNLKTLLLHLHGLGAGASEVRSIPGMYSKFIVSRASQIETVLKLVGTPAEMLVERFRIMWPEGRMEDLLAVMTLKGMRKQDQQALLDGQSTLVASLKSPIGGAGGGTSNIQSASMLSASSLFSLDTSQINTAAASVGRLTQDISVSAMTSLGNLKWGK